LAAKAKAIKKSLRQFLSLATNPFLTDKLDRKRQQAKPYGYIILQYYYEAGMLLWPTQSLKLP